MPRRGVPAYGEQFYDPADRPDHAFLDRVRFDDQAIARALDALALRSTTRLWMRVT